MCEACRDIVAEWLRDQAYDVANGGELGVLLLACPDDGTLRYEISPTELRSA